MGSCLDISTLIPIEQLRGYRGDVSPAITPPRGIEGTNRMILSLVQEKGWSEPVVDHDIEGDFIGGTRKTHEFARLAQIISLCVVVFALVLHSSYSQLFPADSSCFQATVSGIHPSSKRVFGVFYC